MGNSRDPGSLQSGHKRGEGLKVASLGFTRI